MIEAEPAADAPVDAEEGEARSRPEARGSDQLAGASGSSGLGANPKAEVAVSAPRSPGAEGGPDSPLEDDGGDWFD